MKNINKPLPDGGAALPTSETGQRSWGLRKEKEKKKEKNKKQSKNQI